MESKMNKIQRTYLKLLTYTTLNLWDVKRYHSQNQFEFQNTVRLGDILCSYHRPVSKEEMIENKWKIISKINFAGVLFLREFEEIYSYKGNLNLVPDNAVIFSKINVRHGCIYFHKKYEIPFGVSSEYPTFQFDESKVNGAFLQKLLRTTNFKVLLNSKATGISKSRVKKDEFLNIEIPLPSLEEQGRIVNAYNEKIQRAKELEREAEELEKGIEERLFNILGIKKNLLQNRNSKINITSFNILSVWGVERLLRGGNKSVLHSHIFENSLLSERVLINPRTDLAHLGTDEKMSFIPMECISDEYGEVIEIREGKKSLSGGYTKFTEGDLIWARITPCMQNGKSAIVNGLHNGVGYGSTEFHVIRSKNDNVLLDYIYHILRLKTILNDATNYFTGTAGQQRVPKSYLENLSIPIPPIEVQRKISDELYSVKSQIKELNKQASDLRYSAQKEFENEIFNS